jgi:hypothetical protein
MNSESSFRSQPNWRRAVQWNLADLTTFVLALAVVVSDLPLLQAQSAPFWSRGEILLYLQWMIRPILLKLCFATGVAACVRHVFRKTSFRPAEWLALAIAASGPDSAVFRLNQGYEMALYCLSGFWFEIGGITIQPCSHEAVSCILFLAGLLALAAFGLRMPAWGKALLVAALVLVLLWGVLPALARLLGQLAGSTSQLSPSWLPWLVQGTLDEVLAVSRELLVAIPAVATVLSWRRKDRPVRAWTEWVAFGAALLTAAIWLIGSVLTHYNSQLPPGTWMSLSDISPWRLLIAYVISGVLVVSFGPAWDRWMEPGLGKPIGL